MQQELPPSVDILARTLWGEARGCGAAGMSHVAMVIINRVRHPRWWGNDVPTVCVHPSQFSCWDQGDPNLPKIKAVTLEDVNFRVAVDVATQAILGKLPDSTDGADSYYALSMKEPPGWAARATRTFSDGWHAFCRVELPSPNGQPEAPPVSIHAVTADDLNAAELTKHQDNM